MLLPFHTGLASSGLSQSEVLDFDLGGFGFRAYGGRPGATQEGKPKQKQTPQILRLPSRSPHQALRA